jgi:hypothetical protein
LACPLSFLLLDADLILSQIAPALRGCYTLRREVVN